MSNTFYVDCNRTNSAFSTASNNEWTYKLNTEQLLPKGTAIQLQNSFLNKKGINGGSIEIDDDILETIVYSLYITEQAHFNPVGEYVDINNPWYRPTLACDANTFRGNFAPPITGTEVANIVYGEVFAHDQNYNGEYKTPDFASFGGCSQILPHCVWIHDHATGKRHIMPKLYETDIFIPKGVYGIGELGQLIEDQINGIKYYDSVNKKIIDENNTDFRRNNLNDYKNEDFFDGQMYNKPMLQYIECVPRNWQTSISGPYENLDTFLNIKDYTVLMEHLRDTSITSLDFPDDGLCWLNMRGNPAQDAGRTENSIIRPFYHLKTNYDDGTNGADPIGGHKVDDANTNTEFWLYQYTADPAVNTRKRLIGTTNFTFKYDSVSSGFSINGLHNVVKSPSHDRFGTRIESAGQPVINFKKLRRGALNSGVWTANDAGLQAKLEVIGSINTPETRDMGIQIINFGKKTSVKNKTKIGEIFTENCARFSDWFEEEDDAKKAWEETIWYRLGFEYEQLNKPNGKNMIYNRGIFPDYGFTTNSQITNDIIPTVSTLANPADFMPPDLPAPAGYKPPKPKDAPPPDLSTKISGVSMYNTLNYATPTSYAGEAGSNMIGMYANSLFMETSTYPTIISDVGGVIAKRLPTLSKHPYYLITTDLCDNYKDNVKKGDVLPLIGVVPKTSLSNQDFITAENQIVQVISQDKVVNKVHIKVLNPDLTAPVFDENSSVLIKITVPNKTPLALLEQDPNMKKVVPQVVAQQVGSVGN
tara:strand:- start:977 stop:3256 length:2280 start_codon:yes stop_codon:yes gene_type:complete